MALMLGEPGWPRRHTEMTFAGGIGTGKTSMLVTWALMRALYYPGIRIAFVRDTLENLKRSALQTFFERAGEIVAQDAKLRSEYPAYYNKREEKIIFQNGSSIWLFGIADNAAVNRLVGSEWGGIAVDQLERVPLRAYEVLITRLRQKVKHVESGDLAFPMVKSTANLDLGRNHWIVRRFLDGSTPLAADPSLQDDVRERKVVATIEGKRIITFRAYIRARFGENESINPYYLQTLAAAGEAAQAFTTDEWQPSLEEVFPEWKNTTYEEEFYDYENFDIIVGMDYGSGASPSVATFGLYDRNMGNVYLDAELVDQGHDAADFARSVAHVALDYVKGGARRVAIYADPYIWNQTGLGRVADVMLKTMRQIIPVNVPFVLSPAFRRGTRRMSDPSFAEAPKALLREGRLFVHRWKAQRTIEMFSTATWGDIKNDRHPITDIFDAVNYLTMNIPLHQTNEPKVSETPDDDIFRIDERHAIPDWRF